MSGFEKLGKYAFMAHITITVVAGAASVFVSFSTAWVGSPTVMNNSFL